MSSASDELERHAKITDEYFERLMYQEEKRRIRNLGPGGPFFKSYKSQMIELFFGMEASDARVIATILDRMNWKTNQVTITQRELAEATGCSLDTISRSMSYLRGSDLNPYSDGRRGLCLSSPLLVRKANGCYMVNPDYFSMGSGEAWMVLKQEFLDIWSRNERRLEKKQYPGPDCLQDPDGIESPPTGEGLPIE